MWGQSSMCALQLHQRPQTAEMPTIVVLLTYFSGAFGQQLKHSVVVNECCRNTRWEIYMHFVWFLNEQKISGALSDFFLFFLNVMYQVTSCLQQCKQHTGKVSGKYVKHVFNMHQTFVKSIIC